jgi:hypothetical protein
MSIAICHNSTKVLWGALFFSILWKRPAVIGGRRSAARTLSSSTPSQSRMANTFYENNGSSISAQRSALGLKLGIKRG